jgi:hypothetical protein
MDAEQGHEIFKVNQTAAAYVTRALDESIQEAFELHMMSCSECVEEVEIWRVLKQAMPQPSRSRPANPRRSLAPLAHWQLAASLIGVTVIGAASGWGTRALLVPDLTSEQTLVFNLPSVSRGAGECTVLQLGHHARLAIIRLPGVARDHHLIALDGNRHELPSGRYSARTQPDGTRLLQIDPHLLVGAGVYLEARAADGTSNPIGCLVAEIP